MTITRSDILILLSNSFRFLCLACYRSLFARCFVQAQSITYWNDIGMANYLALLAGAASSSVSDVTGLIHKSRKVAWLARLSKVVGFKLWLSCQWQIWLISTCGPDDGHWSSHGWWGWRRQHWSCCVVTSLDFGGTSGHAGRRSLLHAITKFHVIWSLFKCLTMLLEYDHQLISCNTDPGWIKCQ